MNFQDPLRLPLGAPVPFAPPCSRQRPWLVAGDWHSVPRRVLAKQRRAWRNCEGSGIGRFMGLTFNYRRLPGRPLGCLDVNVSVLVNNCHRLRRSPRLRQRRELPLEYGQKLHGQRPLFSHDQEICCQLRAIVFAAN
jgi:hypothetical protein